MISFADTLSDRERMHYRTVAIISAIFGGFTTQVIENNTPVVLFLNMLDASDSLSMFSTSVYGIANILLLIPGATLCAWLGLRRTYSISSIVGFLSFMTVALAPCFGAFSRYAVVCGVFVIGLSQTLYLSSWYPLLDNILRSGERGRFFATMRLIYMVLMALVLYVLGRLLQNNPDIWLLQALFIAAGLSLLVRKMCMDRIPIAPDMRQEVPDIRKSLSICVRNRSLLGYSIYVCFFYVVYASLVPLALVYMKTVLGMAAGTIMILTSVNMAGKIIGFFLLGKVSRSFSTGRQIIATHILTLVTALILLAAVPSAAGLPLIFGVAFFLAGIIYSLISCISSVEMMSLARPGYKIMTMSFCLTSTAAGTAGGTLLSTMLIGCGALAENWQFMGVAVTKFQVMFAACAIGMCGIVLLLPLVPAVMGRHDDYYRP